MVGLRHKQSADQDSDRLYTLRMYGNAFDLGSADTVLHLCAAVIIRYNAPCGDYLYYTRYL